MKSSFSFNKFPVFVFGLLAVFFLQACNISKYIPQKKYLLENVKIKGAPKGEYEELYSLIKQSPNTKVLGVVKINMWLYLLFDTKKKRDKWQGKVDKLKAELALKQAELDKIDTSDKKKRAAVEDKISKIDNNIDNWENREETLKKSVWEEPVLLDSSLLASTEIEFKSYLFNKGFYYDTVTYTVVKRGRKAFVTFNIKPGSAYYINRIDYHIFDKRISDIVTRDTLNRLVKPGDKYDGDLLTAERNRLTLLLRQNGYYNFRRDYIYFDVDTSLAGNLVNVGLGIGNPTARTRHRVYQINKIFVEPEYNQYDKTSKDTIMFGGLYFVSNELRVKPSVLSEFIFMHPGDMYNADDYQSTIRGLSQLNAYKFIDIQFGVDTVQSPDTGRLNVFIRLTPSKKQEIGYDVDLNSVEESQAQIATTRSLGAAISLEDIDKNLGGGAMELAIKPYGSIELPSTILQHANAIDTPTYQYGITTSLIVPRLLWPGKLSEKLLKLPAQTTFNVSYIAENNVEFRRNTFLTNMTWQAKLSANQTISITPVEIGLVQTGFLSSSFDSSIVSTHNPLLIDLFDQHLITDFRMAYLINQQPLTNVTKPYWYLRLSFEAGGNIPALVDRLTANQPRDSGAATNKLFGINYYQYTKVEADYQYYLPVLESDNLAMRIIGGVGVPQGLAGLFFPNTSSTELPFEKQFYVGGANSIRAWKLRTLGPGSYYDPAGASYYDKSGDIKLEANAELRFPIYKILKGAIFIDAGNVWLYTNDTLRPGSGFYFNSFYKQIAVGSGLGFRFDFSYFVVRLDFAVPLRDPSRPEGSEWEFDELLRQSAWFSRNIQTNLGIGYPF